MVIAPSSSRAAFACGGAGESSVHGGRGPQIFLCPHFPSRDNDACCWHRERCIRNCSVHSPPVPGTSIKPPCSYRRPWCSGRGASGRRWHASAAAAAAATLVSRRWHAAAAAVAATLVSRRWHATAAAAAATLASRRWHAAAAAAAATLVSRRWHVAAAAAAAAMV